MDCNRDEALRARAIAEQKMQAGDFSTARKVALKARQLFPELENVVHLLTVCDVHCSSQVKIHGVEMDWYGILQVEKFAEEAIIKKQFRKLALFLHPDKNKFPGAESAFKLISEAQRILTDQAKRLLYDMKCKEQIKPPMPKPPTNKPNENGSHQRGKRSAVQPQGAPSGSYPMPHKQQWPKVVVSCSFCKTQYQLFMRSTNERIFCQSCRRHFIAHNMDPTAPMWNPFSTQRSPNNGSSYPSFIPFHGGVFNHNFVPKADPFTDTRAKVEVPLQGNSSAGTTSNEGNNFNIPSISKVDEAMEQNPSVDNDKMPSNDANIDSKVKDCGVEKSENVGRKSDRKKKRVSYNEADDDVASPMKKQKPFSTSAVEKTMEEINIVDTRKQEADEESKKNKKNHDSFSSSKSKEEMKEEREQKEHENVNYDSPDPQFSDFDSLRDKKMFKVDQVWACYDPFDGMPRFYALITKVHSPRFKLTINWLETRPLLPEESSWFKEELPISCGRFAIGEKQIIKDRDIFSHQISITKFDEYYTVVPRQGETWAIFKDWNIKWILEREAHQPPYELLYVEITSEFDETAGVKAALLKKVEGYNSVYRRATCLEASPFTISKSEMLKFSHPVLSQRITTNASLEGCFELDPASLPGPVIAIYAEPQTRPSDPEIGVKKDDNCKAQTRPSESEVAAKKVDNSEPKAYELQNCAKVRNSCVENGMGDNMKPSLSVVEVTHYDFNKGRAMRNFSVGQIWALFGDKEKLPRQFGCVKGIKFSPVLKVDVVMLNPLFVQKDSCTPSACGKYELSKIDRRELSPSSFSHLVQAVSVNNAFEILPRIGEVWALFKTPSFSAHQSFIQFDYVEVLEGNIQPKVAVLEPMPGGSDSFFRVSKGRKVERVSDLSKFSHQCLAIRPCDVGGDNRLTGCWEIDRLSRTWHVIISTD